MLIPYDTIDTLCVKDDDLSHVLLVSGTGQAMKDCSNTFLERSFIYAAPCEWNKLSECIRTSTFDSFRKSVKTMLFTQQYGC